MQKKMAFLHIEWMWRRNFFGLHSKHSSSAQFLKDRNRVLFCVSSPYWEVIFPGLKLKRLYIHICTQHCIWPRWPRSRGLLFTNFKRGPVKDLRTSRNKWLYVVGIARVSGIEKHSWCMCWLKSINVLPVAQFSRATFNCSVMVTCVWRLFQEVKGILKQRNC